MTSLVMLAVPTLDWRINTQLASFLLELCTGKVDPSEVRFEVCFLPDTQPVHYARNVLAGAFLQSKADRLWFLDADITPTLNVLTMLALDADIVSGRAPIVRPGDDGAPTIVHAAFDRRLPGGAFGYARRASHPVPMIASGAGCLLIRRAVLLDPRMHLSPTYSTPSGELRSLDSEANAAPALFRTPSKPNGEPLLGEDMDFVERASTLGYSCIFDPRAACGHVKRVDLAGVEQMIERELVARRRTAESTCSSAQVKDTKVPP